MDPAEFAGNEGFVTLGVDTHKDAHVAVALDGLSRRLGELSVPATAKGYKALLDWARGHGALERPESRGRGPSGLDSPAI